MHFVKTLAVQELWAMTSITKNIPTKETFLSSPYPLLIEKKGQYNVARLILAP
jgi:hypothetical protein